MIINIRGTSGSGKSTLARAIFEHYAKDETLTYRTAERKQPWYEVHQHPKGFEHPHLATLGHYNTACGGTDTINGFDLIYTLAREAAELGHDVLMEGLLLSAEVKRMIELADHHQILVVMLDLPLQLCIDSVNARRWAKDPTKPGVNPKNTESKWKGVPRCCERLEDAGIEVFRGNRGECQEKIEKVLGVR